jgi:protein SCO1/2
MTNRRKLLTRIAWFGGIGLFAAVLIWKALDIANCLPSGGPAASNETETEIAWKVPDFEAVDQNGKTFKTSDLKGKVWIADFIFTNCNTVCPPMTANMALLQKRLKFEGLDVEIVSFSVDPERDDPKALREFGKQHNVDFSNWHFLTGYPFEAIQQLSREAFKAEVRMDPESDQVVHGTYFYLVDESGAVRKFYNGVRPDDDQIVQDVKELLGK